MIVRGMRVVSGTNVDDGCDGSDSNSRDGRPAGDTTYRKLFVGGLAWQVMGSGRVRLSPDVLMCRQQLRPCKTISMSMESCRR